MDLKQRLIAYIIKQSPVTLDKLTEVACAKGFSELEVLTALESVHRDKRITQTANTAGVVTYKLANAKKPPGSHLTWVREHYPPMTPETDGSGIEGDYSYLFMSPDEAKEYKAAASGRPAYMVKSKHDRFNTRRLPRGDEEDTRRQY